MLAVDGSKFTLPNLPVMLEKFDGQKNQSGDINPMALVSIYG